MNINSSKEMDLIFQNSHTRVPKTQVNRKDDKFQGGAEECVGKNT